jgi:aryl-alcohol dehydrogenase-like predicted oxidoreductase
MCRAFGIGVIPFPPLASGLLTGKYRPGEPIPEGTRFYGRKDLQATLTEQTLGRVARLEDVARRHGRPVSQLAIAWLLARPEVSTVIAGATRPEQVDENVKAEDWDLDAATLAEIAAILE